MSKKKCSCVSTLEDPEHRMLRAVSDEKIPPTAIRSTLHEVKSGFHSERALRWLQGGGVSTGQGCKANAEGQFYRMKSWRLVECTIELYK